MVQRPASLGPHLLLARGEPGAAWFSWSLNLGSRVLFTAAPVWRGLAPGSRCQVCLPGTNAVAEECASSVSG